MSNRNSCKGDNIANSSYTRRLLINVSLLPKMADYTRTKPLGQLLQLPIQIASQEYKIDFIILRPMML